MEKMSLRELLNYVEFDYEIIKNDNEDYTEEYERGAELIKLILIYKTFISAILLILEFGLISNLQSTVSLID